MKEELPLERDVFPRIATPFGAGLGRSGLLCGAVSGVLMGIGLLQGRDRATESKEPVYDAARRFVSLFRSRFGSVDCLTLTGFDLSDPVQRREAEERKIHDKVCRIYLEWAAGYLAGLIPPRTD